ncbi:uncharacterized protein LOC132717664 [Ruditapes philippinarum]|uniref:uncharacterized protein LOC132717664 n=1 Tax=Ruditapes philippinarum TaxID=129788 RepID=UPI00295B2323|nr:uncharacterized protein LOC132717664 [Ruditapes philippinarum]
MTETTYLQDDGQDKQRENYGLVGTQGPENDQSSCGCFILKCLRRLIRCLCRTICWLLSFFNCCCCPRCYKGNVQIFIPVQTPTTFGFSSAISRLCKEISYKCQLCYDVAMLHEALPLVVVCQISSRFEPDIDFALNDIKWKKPFVVLLLHCGLESSLPTLPTASKLGNMEKYQNIEFIDVAYNIDSELYPCKTNKTARSQLQTFFKINVKA